jgi:hypothetical protein
VTRWMCMSPTLFNNGTAFSICTVMGL